MSTDLSVLGGLTEYGKLTSSSVTTIYTASLGTTRIRSLQCCENNAGTPTLTVEAYDGTNIYYLRKGLAVAAGTPIVFNEAFYLPQGWSLRLTSSDAQGEIDWILTYDSPSRAAALR